MNNLSIVFSVAGGLFYDDNFTEEELFNLDHGTMFEI
jgi:hypothetical protein